MKDNRSFSHYLLSHLGSHYSIYAQGIDSRTANNERFWFALNTVNGIPSYNERQPLHLGCFITFLRCTMKIGRDPGRIWQLLMVHIVPFSTKVYSQIAHKISASGYPHSITNGMVCHQERHPLLLSAP